MPRTARTSGSVRSKGQKGEREVVALFRANGYPDAVRSPGSGALRSSGAGSLSPWPGDLARVKPWLIEVKRTEKSHTGTGKTWPGSTFVKGTLRDLIQLAEYHQRLTTPTPTMIPALFIRGALEPWRVFVTAARLHMSITGNWSPTIPPDHQLWAEVDVPFFFEHIVPPVRDS